MKKEKKKYCITKNSLQNGCRTVLQYTLQSLEQSPVQSTAQPSVQSNDTYIHGVGILTVLAISICVFFAYNTF